MRERKTHSLASSFPPIPCTPFLSVYRGGVNPNRPLHTPHFCPGTILIQTDLLIHTQRKNLEVLGQDKVRGPNREKEMKEGSYWGDVSRKWK
jgi:hypothetical protein